MTWGTLNHFHHSGPLGGCPRRAQSTLAPSWHVPDVPSMGLARGRCSVNLCRPRDGSWGSSQRRLRHQLGPAPLQGFRLPRHRLPQTPSPVWPHQLPQGPSLGWRQMSKEPSRGWRPLGGCEGPGIHPAPLPGAPTRIPASPGSATSLVSSNGKLGFPEA